MARNEKSHGYHWALFSVPVASWKIAEATRTAIETRSRASRTSLRVPRSGRRNSRG